MSSRSYILQIMLWHQSLKSIHYRTLLIFQNKKTNRFEGQNMGGMKDMLSPHVKTWGDISPPPSPQDLRSCCTLYSLYTEIAKLPYPAISICILLYSNTIFSSFFFFRKNYLLLSCATSVRPSVCPSVEIISFRGNSLPNRPIELKIGLNVREGVVHVRKA